MYLNYVMRTNLIMAIKHTLSLDIPDIACENVIRIVDTSLYGRGLAISCQRLDITLPGFTSPVYIYEADLTPGFMKNISAVDLGLQPESNTGPMSLPDGLYIIKYSVSPNDKVYVEYYHLRTTLILNQYYKEICKLRLEACEPTAEVKQKLQDLRYIKMFIDAAKAKAEVCHAPNQAVDMLSYANKLLQRYLTGDCITCR